MLYYIAGKMTGIKDYNYPAFYEAEERLTALGHRCMNPARLSAPLGMDAKWEEYMRNSLKHLMDCEGIALLPNWEDSRGARLEHTIAVALGMAVLYLSTEKP
jgi:hypothetical protein